MGVVISPGERKAILISGDCRATRSNSTVLTATKQNENRAGPRETSQFLVGQKRVITINRNNFGCTWSHRCGVIW